MELGEKALLWRRAAWFRGQRGLRELTVTTFPGGVVDCSSWAGLTEAVEPVFVSGAWDRKGQGKPAWTEVGRPGDQLGLTECRTRQGEW